MPKKEKEKPVEKPKPWADAKPLPTNKFRPLTDKELEFYGSLNWDDNPPINGFYEAMMSIAYAQLAERERQAAEKEADKDYKSETIVEGGTVIEKTEGVFIPGRQPRVAAQKPEKAEVDMSPRPFSEDIQFFHHNGSMVVQDGLVGFLSEVRKNSDIQPVGVETGTDEARHALCHAVGNVSATLQL